MKFTTFFALAFISVYSFGQVKVAKIDSSNLPRNVKYIGHIINAVKWTDSLGQNLVITTETGQYISKTIPEDGYKDAALYGYHYILNGDSVKLTWKVYDFNNECPVDLDLYFIDKSFAITDLDKNGITEV